MPYDDIAPEPGATPHHQDTLATLELADGASLELAAFEADVRMTLSLLEPGQATVLRNRIAEALRRGYAGTH